MPGLVGLVTRLPRARAEGELVRMLSRMTDEPFYSTGSWIDPDLGVYTAWTLRQDSSADSAPLTSERNRVLILSGEQYSSSESLARRIGGAEGATGLAASLNGRFHGLLLNGDEQSATLFNDRYGLHRLYYHRSADAFYFAAEAKAILEIRPELRSADLRSLGELVACGCVLENRTLFNGISVLPGGSAWVFRKGILEHRNTYFHPTEWEQQPVLDSESYYQELRSAFSRCLPRYFGGHERIGMSLTGGLDTRMIMAWTRSSPGSLPCYSFAGSFRDSHDVRVAREVAAACQQPYSAIPIGSEFLGRFPQYAERTVSITDGCVGVNHSADLYANERARAIAPVRLTGNYGGEVLRQVRAFKPIEPTPGLFSLDFLPHVRAAQKTYAGTVETHPLSFAVFRQATWHHHGLLALEESQLALRSPYLDNDFVKVAFRAPQAALTSNDVCLRLIADGSPALRRIPTDRGFAGDRTRVIAALSQRWLDLTFKAEYAYDYGMPQWAARIDRRLSRLHPERLFLGRHKFTHFRLWYRTVLSAYVRDTLLDRRSLSRPYLQPAVVETLVQGHLRGDRNYTSDIHKLLTLELIHRLFLDAPSAAAAATSSDVRRRHAIGPLEASESNSTSALHAGR